MLSAILEKNIVSVLYEKQNLVEPFTATLELIHRYKNSQNKEVELVLNSVFLEKRHLPAKLNFINPKYSENLFVKLTESGTSALPIKIVDCLQTGFVSDGLYVEKESQPIETSYPDPSVEVETTNNISASIESKKLIFDLSMVENLRGGARNYFKDNSWAAVLPLGLSERSLTNVAPGFGSSELLQNYQIKNYGNMILTSQKQTENGIEFFSVRARDPNPFSAFSSFSLLSDKLPLSSGSLFAGVVYRLRFANAPAGFVPVQYLNLIFTYYDETDHELSKVSFTEPTVGLDTWERVQTTHQIPTFAKKCSIEIMCLDTETQEPFVLDILPPQIGYRGITSFGLDRLSDRIASPLVFLKYPLVIRFKIENQTLASGLRGVFDCIQGGDGFKLYFTQDSILKIVFGSGSSVDCLISSLNSSFELKFKPSSLEVLENNTALSSFPIGAAFTSVQGRFFVGCLAAEDSNLNGELVHFSIHQEV